MYPLPKLFAYRFPLTITTVHITLELIVILVSFRSCLSQTVQSDWSKLGIYLREVTPI